MNAVLQAAQEETHHKAREGETGDEAKRLSCRDETRYQDANDWYHWNDRISPGKELMRTARYLTISSHRPVLLSF